MDALASARRSRQVLANATSPSATPDWPTVDRQVAGSVASLESAALAAPNADVAKSVTAVAEALRTASGAVGALVLLQASTHASAQQTASAETDASQSIDSLDGATSALDAKLRVADANGTANA
jgi:hypothetical protein